MLEDYPLECYICASKADELMVEDGLDSHRYGGVGGGMSGCGGL